MHPEGDMRQHIWTALGLGAASGAAGPLGRQPIIRPACRLQQINDGNPSTEIHVFKVGLEYSFN